MNRRLVIAGIAGLISTVPLADGGQKPKRRLAMLSPGSLTTPRGAALFDAFWDGMRSCGYSPDDFELETRWADFRPERLSALATELVRLTPEVIVAAGPAAVAAARKATPIIPIVMLDVADPVGAGFVASLVRPGGSVTGLANLAQETAGKRLELLKAATPAAARIAVLFNPGNPGNLLQLHAAEDASKALSIDVIAIEARTVDEIEPAFAAIGRERADALFVAGDPVFNGVPDEIVSLAARRKLPSIYQDRNAVLAGGLISYGIDQRALFRQAASYVDKLLKGEKPGELPVQQPTKFELVINLKTANTLGLTIPQALLARADEIIE